MISHDLPSTDVAPDPGVVGYLTTGGLLVGSGAIADVAGVPLPLWAALWALTAVGGGTAWLVREHRRDVAADRAAAAAAAEVPSPAPAPVPAQLEAA